MKMSNPIIERVTTKLAEQEDKIRITKLDENEHDIFDARVNKYVTAKLAEQEDNIRIAKLERNLDKKHNIFDIFDGVKLHIKFNRI
jgi:CRISPR/Cas system-associated endoribonuclease Cas2